MKPIHIVLIVLIVTLGLVWVVAASRYDFKANRSGVFIMDHWTGEVIACDKFGDDCRPIKK